ncbi:hypothetical protein D7X55_10205 [Corallococcus sp. AB049A]|uniref:Uncharacterized protein n=1 Tax=Corallococcus interemptor TaxID=2316720 RepID=A0A3A8QUK4_9BACT|nr:hypothetical protein D7X96_05375 [Corallococcus interemptor]RKI70350.1 hypothetical protein D7X55_10205 [Corallococcus sp. AB049A]
MGELGTVQAEYEGEWRYFSDVQQGVLTAPDDPASPEVSRLAVCGWETEGRGLFDDSNVCFNLRFDTALLGAGPATFGIDGAVVVPVQAGIDPTFTPGEAHGPGVRAAWVHTGCYGQIQEDDVRQQVTGTLELRVNDATRFAGHLVLDMTGASSGQCSTSRARADVEFDLPR